MKSSFRIFLTLVISFQIIVTGSPFQLYHEAKAQEAAETAVDEAELQKERAALEGELANLREAFVNPAKKSTLDPFDLAGQIVEDVRPSKIAAVVQQAKIEDYEARLTYYSEELTEIEEIRAKALAELARVQAVESQIPVDPAGESMPRPAHPRELGINTILADLDSREQIINMELKALENQDPRRGEGINIEHMIDTEIPTRHYWGRKMVLQILQDGAVVSEVKQVDFTESLSPGFNKENPLNEMRGQGEFTFAIANEKGEVLHRFLRPVESVFFFGHYLVYVEKQAVESNTKILPVRFIDLRFFKANIGNSPLPVFTMPVNIEGRPDTFAIEDGYLKVGEQRLTYQQMDMLSKVHQIIFNVNVALIDPGSYSNVTPLIEDILKYYELSMKSQDALFQSRMEAAFANDEYLRTLTESFSSRPRVSNPAARGTVAKATAANLMDPTEAQQISNELDIRDTTLETNEALFRGRQFFNRMRLLSNHLFQPRPEGAPKLFNSLMIAAYGDTVTRERIWDFSKDSFTVKLAKYGAVTGGALLAATMLPEPYTFHFAQANQFIGDIYQHFIGYLDHIKYGKAYADLSGEAFVTSTTGWAYMYDAYLADGKWGKFLFGLGSVLLIPLQVYGLAIFVTNSFKLFRKTMEMRQLGQGEYGFLKSFKMAAIADQNRYWKVNADAEKELSGSDAEKMTELDHRLITEHVDRLNNGRESLEGLYNEIEKGHIVNRSLSRTFLSTLAGYKKVFKFGNSVEATYSRTQHQMSLDSNVSLGWALKKSFLSYASMVTAESAVGIFWGYLFLFRTFAWDPAKWMMVFIYPNYFSSAIRSFPGTPYARPRAANNGQPAVKEVKAVPGMQNFPSRYDGGLELWPAKIQRLLSRWTINTRVAKVPGYDKLFLSKEALINLDRFEAEVLKAEIVAIEFAKKHAQKALFNMIEDPARLEVFFDSAQVEGRVSTGIRTLFDKKLKTLTTRERIFYRAFFTRTYDTLMQRFVSEFSNTSIDSTMDPEIFAKKFVAELRAGEVDQFNFAENRLAEVEAQVEQTINLRAIRDWSTDAANKLSELDTRINVQFRHRLLKDLHPQNPQIRRFSTSERMLKEPRAVQRAVRTSVASLTTSIPMGIVSTLGLFAGVQSGILQPFDASAYNSETHTMYMSNYLFYSGFIPGLIIGLIAGTWMKVQEDAQTEEKGGFDKEVTFADGKKGFWRYYFKNAFKNPGNKWVDRQTYYLKLITANLPAAMVTILAADLYGMGRVDVDTLLAQYLLLYTTFLTGFNFKMDQAFEMASIWMRNKIPASLRANKIAMEKINGMIQAKRMQYTFYDTLYGTFIMSSIIGSLMTLKDSTVYGTRAFMRMLFGGETPTAIVSGVVDRLVDVFHSIPGIEMLGNGAKHLITNNYEAMERFTPKLMEQAAEGAVRVVENPNLPTNGLAEAIGKGTAIVAGLGASTAAPYLILGRGQRQRTKGLVKQGEIIMSNRCSQIFSQ